jgi:hypothetical protein
MSGYRDQYECEAAPGKCCGLPAGFWFVDVALYTPGLVGVINPTSAKSGYRYPIPAPPPALAPPVLSGYNAVTYAAYAV